MAGEKNKWTTLEKKYGFEDKELTTPKHDDLVIKLLDKNYFIKYIIREYSEGLFDLETLDIKSEIPIHSYNSFIIGYWDIVASCISSNHKTKYYLMVEVKPSIRSFGETLRQINTYKSFFRKVKTEVNLVFIFSPDLRFKEQFEGQDIYVRSPNNALDMVINNA